MSRSKHGHKHIGRAKCGVCSLANTASLRDERFVLSAQEQISAPQEHSAYTQTDDDDDNWPEYACECYTTGWGDDEVYVTCATCLALAPSEPLKASILELL
jgi:hypothetical protein